MNLWRILILACGLMLAIAPAFACIPPPPGSVYEKRLAEIKAKAKAESAFVVRGIWRNSASAKLRNQRIDAYYARNPGTNKHYGIRYTQSYGTLVPQSVIRGGAAKRYTIWFSHRNQSCPSDEPPAGVKGTFYFNRVNWYATNANPKPKKSMPIYSLSLFVPDA